MHPTPQPENAMVVIGYLIFTLWGVLVGLFLGWLVFA